MIYLSNPAVIVFFQTESEHLTVYINIFSAHELHVLVSSV